MDVSSEISRLRQAANLIPLKPAKVKKRISEYCVPNMTLDLLRERDPDDEVIGWLRNISYAAAHE